MLGALAGTKDRTGSGDPLVTTRSHHYMKSTYQKHLIRTGLSERLILFRTWVKPLGLGPQASPIRIALFFPASDQSSK